MVKMETDLGILPSEFLGILDGTLCHIAEEGLVGIVAGTLRNLEDDRGPLLGASLDDGLQLLHVVEIECRDGISTLYGLREHFPGVHKTQFFE
jgi:hypothetical protein